MKHTIFLLMIISSLISCQANNPKERIVEEQKKIIIERDSLERKETQIVEAVVDTVGKMPREWLDTDTAKVTAVTKPMHALARELNNRITALNKKHDSLEIELKKY